MDWGGILPPSALLHRLTGAASPQRLYTCSAGTPLPGTSYNICFYVCADRDIVSLLHTGHKILATKYWPQNTGHKLLATKYWPQNTGNKITGHKILATKYWPQNTGHKILAVALHCASLHCDSVCQALTSYWPRGSADWLLASHWLPPVAGPLPRLLWGGAALLRQTQHCILLYCTLHSAILPLCHSTTLPACLPAALSNNITYNSYTI